MFSIIFCVFIPVDTIPIKLFVGNEVKFGVEFDCHLLLVFNSTISDNPMIKFYITLHKAYYGFVQKCVQFLKSFRECRVNALLHGALQIG